MSVSHQLKDLMNPRRRLLQKLSSPATAARFFTREVTVSDVAALRALELEKWGAEGASEEVLRKRIENTPGFCWASFNQAGDALASLFVMGVKKERALESPDWFATTDHGTGASHDPAASHWFGISLSSTDSHAGSEVIVEAVTEVLRRGVREVYLGSPVPGFKRWLKRNPGGRVEAYVELQEKERAPSIDTDPLLSFYLQLGFKIVRTRPAYFPNEGSLDHGVLIRFPNPLWVAAPLFRRLSRAFFRNRVMRLIAAVEAL